MDFSSIPWRLFITVVWTEISLAGATHNSALIIPLKAGYEAVVVILLQGYCVTKAASMQMVLQLASNRLVTLFILGCFTKRAGFAAGFALDAERSIIEYMVVADTARASTAGADSGFSALMANHLMSHNLCTR